MMTDWYSLFGWSRGGAVSAGSRRRAHHVRPHLEKLEGREAPIFLGGVLFPMAPPPAMGQVAGEVIFEGPTSDVIAIGAQAGSVTGVVGGVDQDNEAPSEDKIAICHHTSSATNPFVLIRIPMNAVEHHFENHGGVLVGIVHDTHGGQTHEDHADKFPTRLPDGTLTCDDGHPQDEQGDAHNVFLAGDGVPVRFRNKTHVTITANDDDNTIVINLRGRPRGLRHLTIDGGGGEDTVIIKNLHAKVQLHLVNVEHEETP